MKILMIGHSGAGKTSFMAGMYKYLGEKKTGYGIQCVDEKQKKQLNRLVERLNQGIYPAGTDIQSIYQFNFTMRGKFIMPFDWVDYRGGALSASSENDPELNNLVKQINACDALIIFLDGAKLTKYTLETECEYNIISSCVEKALDKSRKTWLPVSFVITKDDTISPNAKLVGLEYFSTFLEIASNSKIVHAMVCKSAVTKDKCTSTLLPLLFSIYGGTPGYIEKCKLEEKVRWNNYQEKKPTSLLGKIFAKVEEVAEDIASNISYKYCWVTTNDEARWALNSWHEKYELLQRLEKETMNMQTELSKYKKLNKIKIYGK